MRRLTPVIIVILLMGLAITMSFSRSREVINPETAFSLRVISGEAVERIRLWKQGDDTFLVWVSNLNYSWTAYLDEEKTEILRSDIMYMSILIPEGEHCVELRYETPWLKTGIMISATVLMLWLGYEYIKFRKTDTKTKP